VKSSIECELEPRLEVAVEPREIRREVPGFREIPRRSNRGLRKQAERVIAAG